MFVQSGKAKHVNLFSNMKVYMSANYAIRKTVLSIKCTQNGNLSFCNMTKQNCEEKKQNRIHEHEQHIKQPSDDRGLGGSHFVLSLFRIATAEGTQVKGH